MKQWLGLVAVPVLCVGLLGAPSWSYAQDPAAPPEPATPEPSVTPPPAPQKKHRMGLYVAAGFGNASADTLDNSIETTLKNSAQTSLKIDAHDQGRAAIGWKLPEGKGDFRIAFTGYKETGYELRSQGLETRINSSNQDCISPSGVCLIPWWTVTINDGELVSQRFPPQWDSAVDDTNGNGQPDLEEIHVLGSPDITVTRTMDDTLQNQIQTFDFLYGREFGGRRLSSRWWAGLRAFEYRGNMLATAWLGNTVPGEHFTEGSFYRLLNFSQDTSGFGPTGSWEIDFNFFEKRLMLYLRGQSAFTFNSYDIDSGVFFTHLRNSETGLTQPVPARLHEKRDKSSWQNTAEGGVRWLMRNGLQFELAYNFTGYLDAVLAPNKINIPLLAAQAGQGTSGLYHHQDYVVKGWHAGVGFQF